MKLLPALLITALARPHLSFDEVAQPADVGLLRHVGREGLGLAAGLLDGGLDLVELALRARHHDHGRAEFGHRLGGRAPDPGAGAGDDHHLAVELHLLEHEFLPRRQSGRRSAITASFRSARWQDRSPPAMSALASDFGRAAARPGMTPEITLLRRAHLHAAYSLSVSALQRRQHLAREQADVPLGQIARQRAELQQARAGSGSRAAGASPVNCLRTVSGLPHTMMPCSISAIDGVLLAADRALVAAHVLQRLGR